MVGKYYRPISLHKVPVSYPQVGVFVQYAGSSPQPTLGSTAAKISLLTSSLAFVVLVGLGNERKMLAHHRGPCPSCRIELEKDELATMCLANLLTRECRRHGSALRAIWGCRTLRVAVQAHLLFRPIVCVPLGRVRSPACYYLPWSLFPPWNRTAKTASPRFMLLPSSKELARLF